MDQIELDAVAEKLFSSIERGDLEAVRELYADDVEIWHNVTGRVQTRDENLGLLETFTSRVSDLHYEVLGRDFFAGGFVQRHILHGRATSGAAIHAPVCIVIYAAQGRIQRLFEYLDATAVEAAFARPAARRLAPIGAD
jgi:ketosteroid isomerase-like protein